MMKCPECKAKITSKHYDPEYEWYECPKCEGAFTADEIEEADNGTSVAGRRTGASAVGSGASGTTARGDGKTKAVAKGKKRQADRDADADLADKMVEEISKSANKKSGPKEVKHRDELETSSVVNIMADEIQTIYEEMGGRLDEKNAQDKALILYRELRAHGTSAREIAVPHVHCLEHAA